MDQDLEVIYDDSSIWMQDGHIFDHDEDDFTGDCDTYCIIQSFFGPILPTVIVIVIVVRLSNLLFDLAGVGQNLKYSVTSAFGLYSMYFYTTTVDIHDDYAAKILLIVTILVFTFHQYLISHDRTPTIVLILAACFPILANEFLIFVHHRSEYSSFRPALATLVMKFIDQTIRYNHKQPSAVSRLCHLIHPASCLFGPWFPASTLVRVRSKTRLEYVHKFKAQLIRAFITLTKAISFLAVSMYINNIMTQATGELPILGPAAHVFTVAMEFRFSHYYMCYVTMSLLQFSVEDDRDTLGFHQVCNLVKVEWPYSLTDVVTSWNIPMHMWLKDCVFKPARSKTNDIALSILITYTVSSSLHGFKFHIWSVLLTLGLLTWAEHRLRYKLSKSYNACLAARRCTYDYSLKCTRGHKSTEYNSKGVRLTNMSFRVLAMLHLAYLGYIFQGNTDASSAFEAIQLWSELYFFSHILGLLTVLASIYLFALRDKVKVK